MMERIGLVALAPLVALFASHGTGMGNGHQEVETELEIRPSFWLPTCAWHATHIVVAAEGERIDGKLQVLESWRGHLKPGARLELPDLAKMAVPRMRQVGTLFQKPMRGGPALVTGRRMVVFLRQEKNGNDVVWHPASTIWKKEFTVSAAWIENGHAYARVQVMNPGDAVMTALGKSEKEFESEIDVIGAARHALLGAAKVEDPKKRIAIYARFTGSSNHEVAKAAFAGLGECGEASLPVLRRMLADEKQTDIHARVVRSMARAGGPSVGPDLTSIIERDLAFWKRRAPTLAVGWWNGTGLEWKDLTPIRTRYSRMIAALRELQKLEFPGCRTPVEHLRNYWKSLPQLNDKSGLDQIIDECNRILHRPR